MTLTKEPNFFEPGKRYFRDYSPGDDFYEAFIEVHRDLSDAQSHELNIRLVLLLANHLGDISVLKEAFAIARNCVLEENADKSSQ